MPDGCADDRRDRDRQLGSHYRRLFARASGDPAWLTAAACHCAYLRYLFRPNLYSPREYRAVRWGCGLFHTSGALALAWYRGCDHNGRRWRAGIRRYLETVGLVLVAGRASHCAARDDGAWIAGRLMTEASATRNHLGRVDDPLAISPSTSNGRTNPNSTSSRYACVFLASRAGPEILCRSLWFDMPDARSVSSSATQGGRETALFRSTIPLGTNACPR